MARAMTNFRGSDMPGVTGQADIVDTPEPQSQPEVKQESRPDPHPPAPEAQTETGTSETLSADDVPYGTTPVVLAWVNGDKARAQLAYDKEQTLIPPRKGLSNELLEIIQR
jgi:hypothetical protein